MEVKVTSCTSVEELGKAFAPISHYFGMRSTAEDIERIGKVSDYRRALMAMHDGAVVGGAGSHAYELTVPGGSVRAAGVTIVGVLPMYRRRGVLRSMMRAQLEQIHAWGEPVAYLWASEETIYGRYGYGIASVSGEFELPKAACVLARPFTARSEIRFLEEEEAYGPISQLYDRIRVQYPGMFSRSEGWWKLRRLADPDSRRGSNGVLNRVLLTLDGEPAAYALYRVNQSLDAGLTGGSLIVVEALATTPEAMREIWKFLLEIDWLSKVKASLLPPDHPLFFLLARPRMMRFQTADGVWVRLVDVEKALAARTYQTGEPVVLAVRDELCPWNEGRYRVSSAGVERVTTAPDLDVPVSDLGSVYLGGFKFAQLARAGRIDGDRGTIARADRLFATDVGPWCPEIF